MPSSLMCRLQLLPLQRAEVRVRLVLYAVQGARAAHVEEDDAVLAQHVEVEVLPYLLQLS